MNWHHVIACFFGGALLTNAIPHLVSGVMGRAFQSPLAKPHGVGLSSSTVNVLWGWCNLAIAYVLLFHVGAFDLHDDRLAIAGGVGMLLAGVGLARMFGRLYDGNAPAKNGESR
jgi:hypothetical protein